MGLGKNNYMCFHCRSRTHDTTECSSKVICSECNVGWRKRFLVDKDGSPFKGQLFYTCSLKSNNGCKYWKLVGPPKKGDPDYEEGESSYDEGESRDANKAVDDEVAVKLEKCADIAEKTNVDVSLRVYEFTFRKRKE